MNCPLCQGNVSKIIGSKANISVSECEKCRFLFTDPMPSDEDIARFYQDYHSTDYYNNKALKKTLTALGKILLAGRYNKLSNKTFLDVGCNIGAIVNAANMLGYRAMGIDLDQQTIDRAKQKYTHSEFSATSIESLAESGRKFDMVFCMEVIEHTPHIHQFTKALHKLLNNNGILYLTTPDAGHKRVPDDFVTWKAVRPIEHLVWFNRDNMQKLLEQHGFKIIKFYRNSRTTIRLIAQA